MEENSEFYEQSEELAGEQEEEDHEYEEEEEDFSSFGALPEEVLIHLVGFLDGREILRLQCVSRRFRRVGGDARVWERLCLRDFKMRYLTSQALWINYTRGYASPSSSGILPFFPFAQPSTKHTVVVRPPPVTNQALKDTLRNTVPMHPLYDRG